MSAVKRRRAVKGLVFPRRETKYRSGMLLLLGEAISSLPTKNFVELRSNDVGTTAGERGLIPGKAQVWALIVTRTQFLANVLTTY